MADNSQPMQVDLHAHVLPLLDLCRYAALASTAVDGLRGLASVHPGFEKQLRAAAPEVFGGLAEFGGDMVAGMAPRKE